MWAFSAGKSPASARKSRVTRIWTRREAPRQSLRALVQMHGFNRRCPVSRFVSATAGAQDGYPIISVEKSMLMKTNPAPGRGLMRHYSSADVRDQLKPRHPMGLQVYHTTGSRVHLRGPFPRGNGYQSRPLSDASFATRHRIT